ncbi:MAG: L-dopachrome tautomerase-related protein [Thermomicrobiales bacterium]
MATPRSNSTFPASRALLRQVAPAPPAPTPLAAGGGVPRVAAAGIDDLAGAGQPAPAGLELVAALEGPLLVGVAVSSAGRIFLNWPRWGDPVAFTVGELREREVVPYPTAAVNTFDPRRPGDTFVSVQAIGFDLAGRLWILDTGSLNFQPVIPGGAKLVAVDPARDQIVQTIVFPPDVVLPTSSINDMRFDLRRGAGGVAYLTDASPLGKNAIITVDLDSGDSWRRLDEHPTTVAEPGFVPIVEGAELYEDMPGMPPRPISLGADGIALSADGSQVFYSPLASRQLFMVATEPLAIRAAEAEVAAAVVDLGTKGSGSDGLESDASGNVYLTQYELNAIAVRGVDGGQQTLVADGRILWPDTMAVANDAYLYFTANQLHRQPRYHDGQDLRQPPYALFRYPVNTAPVRLG